MTRRQVVRTGLGGAALLALGTIGYSLGTRDAAPADVVGHTFTALDDEARAIVAAIAPVMLAGALPDGPQHDGAVRRVVAGFDTAVAALPLAVQAEIRQLFGLLGFPPTRAAAAGIWTEWSSASPDAIAAFLRRWQFSGSLLLRSGYQALHQLTLAAWYANPASWPAVGYPGPPAVR